MKLPITLDKKCLVLSFIGAALMTVLMSADAFAMARRAGRVVITGVQSAALWNTGAELTSSSLSSGIIQETLSGAPWARIDGIKLTHHLNSISGEKSYETSIKIPQTTGLTVMVYPPNKYLRGSVPVVGDIVIKNVGGSFSYFSGSINSTGFLESQVTNNQVYATKLKFQIPTQPPSPIAGVWFFINLDSYYVPPTGN